MEFKIKNYGFGNDLKMSAEIHADNKKIITIHVEDFIDARYHVGKDIFVQKLSESIEIFIKTFLDKDITGKIMDNMFNDVAKKISES